MSVMGTPLRPVTVRLRDEFMWDRPRRTKAAAYSESFAWHVRLFDIVIHVLQLAALPSI
jgi:hypothetical protein